MPSTVHSHGPQQCYTRAAGGAHGGMGSPALGGSGAGEQGKGCPGTPGLASGAPMVAKPTPCFSSQKVDVTSKAVTEVLARTIEYLQPNPGRGAGQLSQESAGYRSRGMCGLRAEVPGQRQAGFMGLNPRTQGRLQSHAFPSHCIRQRSFFVATLV